MDQGGETPKPTQALTDGQKYRAQVEAKGYKPPTLPPKENIVKDNLPIEYRSNKFQDAAARQKEAEERARPKNSGIIRGAKVSQEPFLVGVPDKPVKTQPRPAPPPPPPIPQQAPVPDNIRAFTPPRPSVSRKSA